METSNMDSDEDVIFVETEPVEIEVITVSDDETNNSSTSISTFSSAMTSSRSVKYIKREINSAVIGAPTPLQYISPLQLFSQNRFANGFRVVKQVKKSIPFKSKKPNNENRQIRMIVSKLETTNYSLKNSENTNKAVLNQLQENNIQMEKQTAPSSELSRSNNLNVEPEGNDSYENSRDQNVDMANQSQTTRSDIEKPESPCNLNVEPLTTMECNDLQDDLKNQNVLNESQAGLSSNVEETGSPCNLNVKPPISMEQDDLGNQSIANEEKAGQSSDMEMHSSSCELNGAVTATVEDNYLQDNSRSQNVIMTNEAQADPTSTVELLAKLEYNDREINKDENPPAQQPATNNTSQVQEGHSYSMQHDGNENPPTQLPATNNTPNVQQNRSHSMQNHRNENLPRNPPAQQLITSNIFHLQKDSHSLTHKLFKNPKFSQSEYSDSLLSVIVEEGYPDVQYLTEHHLLILRRLVGFEIDNVLATGKFVPRFRDSYVENGVILVRSADTESQTWLQSIVPKLNPDGGVKLTIVSPRELNQMYRVKILVLHDSNTQQLILKRIQRQNPDINMKSWQLQSVHRLNGAKNTAKSGSILHMLVPAYSVKLLEKKAFKLHYGLYQVDVIIKDAFYKKKC